MLMILTGVIRAGSAQHILSPVIDGMDAISAFMSLPEVVQLAALGVAYSSHDMPDEVRAKLCKALGLGLRNSANIDSDTPDKDTATTALAFLRRALELHARAGVKKDIERLERLLKA